MRFISFKDDRYRISLESLGKSNCFAKGEYPKWKAILRTFAPSPHFLFLVPESITQSTGAKQMKNPSKAFHLLLMPSACRQALHTLHTNKSPPTRNHTGTA